MKNIALSIILLATWQHSNATYSFGVKIIGKGKPMIFIPGFNGSGDTWSSTVDYFKNKYTCYVITLAGFAGQPPSGAHDSLLTRQKDEIIQFIKDKKLVRPVIAGFSFGGTLALWIACSVPELIGPVIDIDGVPYEAAFFDEKVNKDSLDAVAAKKHDKYIHFTADDWQKVFTDRNSPQGLREGIDMLKTLVTDSSHIANILQWDVATDLRTSYLMQLQMDTLDLRKTIGNIATPVLVLGSVIAWDDHTPLDSIKILYRRQFTYGSDFTIHFSHHGKHFLMWDDLQWMLGEMDRFVAAKQK